MFFFQGKHMIADAFNKLWQSSIRSRGSYCPYVDVPYADVARTAFVSAYGSIATTVVKLVISYHIISFPRGL